jgi:predicted O-linked N-acetylglucosamine transferase (SPINDLY family)
VALDTFPYNGTVTTLESLWMNVPVITLVGESHAQRVGYSILKNLDLEELIAFTPDEYIEKSVALARSPEKITGLKKVMRKRLMASSICNPEVFTREFELKLKQIWTERLHQAGAEKNAAPLDSSPADANASGFMDRSIQAMGQLRMAMVKLKHGEYQKAIDLAIPKQDTDSLAALAAYIRGVASYQLDKPEEAVSALERCLVQDPENSGARELLQHILEASHGTAKPPADFGSIETIQ